MVVKISELAGTVFTEAVVASDGVFGTVFTGLAWISGVVSFVELAWTVFTAVVTVVAVAEGVDLGEAVAGLDDVDEALWSSSRVEGAEAVVDVACGTSSTAVDVSNFTGVTLVVFDTVVVAVDGAVTVGANDTTGV